MTTTFTRADSALRSILCADAPALAPHQLSVLVAAAGALQGAAMGSYAVWNGGSPLFTVWAAFKVPLFLGLAAALCYPALRVLYYLLGLSEQWPDTVRALASGQAAFAAILASLSPFTLVFYASGATYRGALIFNLILFALAGIAAQNVVRARLQTLLKREARQLKLWAIGFGMWAFVAVQLAWNLRPFIGSPASPTQFLRGDAFSNVYLGLWKLLTG